MARELNVKRSRNGSQESHLTDASTLRNAFSAISTRYCASTVVPTHAFSGHWISAKRWGNFVRKRKFHCGAARTSSKIASIHSWGTHLPKRSAMEQTKTLRAPMSVAASGGSGVLWGAFKRSG